ncbi:protein unc-93 homolog A [Octopus bimaculoides]|uniref:UNC93-like protein n=1 Tax=Octopus bimaculoides TaxID=37653 RepID=A0A0L8GCZ8_OCTBM|nr:protein unc-93 homolog A [Octopus bimaculoides]|eukprot:XP_014782124.1 PREDICTED: protein unc-93 homolog A-like [Octopus bimaculoides]
MASDEKKLLSGASYKPVVNDCDKLLVASNGCDGCISNNRCNNMTKAATHWSSEQYGSRRCAGNSSYMVPTYHSLPMDIIKRTEYPQSSSPCRGNGLTGHHHHHHYHHHHHHHLTTNSNINNLNNTRSHSNNKQHSGCHPQKVHTVPQYGSPPPSLKDRKSFKNVFVIGFAFMFVYTAFMSLQSLQSSLNTDGGVGVVSLSCMYASTVLSCLLAPWIISKLKCKWTMVSAFILFSAYFAANFYPKHFMLIPAGMILGLLTGPLWSAQATLVTTMGIMHAQRIHNYDTNAVVNKFMGIFYAFYQSSQIWGNIITATVLFNNDTVQAYNPVVEVWRKAATALNESTAISAYIYSRPSSLSYSSQFTWKKCGAKFCDLPFADPGAEYHDYNPIVAGISDDSRHMLLGVYLICGIMGAIIIVALLDKEGQKEESYGNLSSRELCLATVRMLCDPKCQLLMPLVLFLGLQQGFLFGDFTKSYVKCTLGMYSIGLILITFGVVNAISSVAIGYIAKHIKRFAFITAAATFNAGILMVLSLWKPQSLDIPNFYVISACLGLCDAIWQTQTFTLFGVLFMDRQEAAFASYRMFHATGCAIAFGYSYFLCVVTKVYILAGAMGVSLLAYGVIELRLRLQQQDIKDIVAL